MNQNELIDALFDKLSRANAIHPYTILVTGPWGCGKSFAWKEFRRKCTNERIVSVSCFGHDSVESLRNELKSRMLLDLLPKSTSKFLAFKSKMVEAITSAAKGLSQKYIGFEFDAMQLVSFSHLGPDYVVCFDDFERSSNSINTIDLLGLIDEVRQHCKVVIIANEDKLSENKDYIIYKEKVIDRTYHLTETDDTVATQVIHQRVGDVTATSTMLSLFNAHANANLRTLQKMVEFVSDVGNHMSPEPLEESIVRLGCAVILESMIQADSSAVDWATDPTTNKDTYQAYTKYGLKFELNRIAQRIFDFYTTNAWDDRAITGFLHPPTPTRADELLHTLEQFFLFDETTVRAAIDEFQREMQIPNDKFFRGFDQIIRLYFYAGYANDVCQLGYNQQTMEQVAFTLITRLDAQPSVSELGMYRLFFGAAPSIVSGLLGQLEKHVGPIAQQGAINSFFRYYRSADFESCLKVIRMDLSIIPHIISTFADLVTPRCELSRVVFFGSVCDIAKPGQHAPLLHTTLSSLLAKTSDPVIQVRIKQVKQYL